MREYTTAAKRTSEEGTEDEGLLPFKVDGRECVAHMPEPGQMAMLIASLGAHSDEWEQVAGIINFLFAVLDKETHTYLAGRLLDRKDDFGLDEVTEIIEDMISEWSARPTEQRSASTPLPQTAGR